MSICDGTMPTGIKWCFNAWSEATSSYREGAPSFWSAYTFDTYREAVRERDRLERAWSAKHWKKCWGERKGPYVFEVYQVVTTHEPRRK